MSPFDTSHGGDAVVSQPHYQLFLSHSHLDADLVEAMARQLEQLGVACFLDRWEMVPGESSVVGLEQALSASDAVAVVVAGHGMGRWQAEEARQALKLAIDRGTRAFVVWMPGSDPDPPGLSSWLRERSHADLRSDFDSGRVGRRGLVQLVAGALGITPRRAELWLQERLPAVPDGGRSSPGDQGR